MGMLLVPLPPPPPPPPTHTHHYGEIASRLDIECRMGRFDLGASWPGLYSIKWITVLLAYWFSALDVVLCTWRWSERPHCERRKQVASANWTGFFYSSAAHPYAIRASANVRSVWAPPSSASFWQFFSLIHNRARTHARTHIYTHKYIQIYRHIYACIYIHTGVCVCVCVCVCVQLGYILLHFIRIVGDILVESGNKF